MRRTNSTIVDFHFVDEVAERCGVTPKQIYERVRRGVMPPLEKPFGCGRKSGYSGKTFDKFFNQ